MYSNKDTERSLHGFGLTNNPTYGVLYKDWHNCSKECDVDQLGNSFGTRLKTLRMGTGKTQLEVAEELTERYPDFTISQANISHLERREAAPRNEVLTILSDFFGVPISYFLRDVEFSYEARKAKVSTYLDSLDHRIPGIVLHTDDNSSGDKKTLDTTDNLLNWYDATDVSED